MSKLYTAFQLRLILNLSLSWIYELEGAGDIAEKPFHRVVTKTKTLETLDLRPKAPLSFRDYEKATEDLLKSNPSKYQVKL